MLKIPMFVRFVVLVSDSVRDVDNSIMVIQIHDKFALV